jgi:uncharacterized protein YjbI with pentapeptide repeats
VVCDALPGRPAGRHGQFWTESSVARSFPSRIRGPPGGFGPRHNGLVALRLESEGDYEAVEFDSETFAEVVAGGARFDGCTFNGTGFEDVRLRRARFIQTRFEQARVVGTDVCEASMTDVVLDGSVFAGVQAYSSVLRRVTFKRCKLDSVNLRDATLTDVLFEDCVLRDLDFGSAKLLRVRFTGSELTRADFTKVTCTDVDLRDATLGIKSGYDSLRGATVDSVQLVTLAPLLARHLGITVAD